MTEHLGPVLRDVLAKSLAAKPAAASGGAKGSADFEHAIAGALAQLFVGERKNMRRELAAALEKQDAEQSERIAALEARLEQLESAQPAGKSRKQLPAARKKEAGK